MSGHGPGFQPFERYVFAAGITNTIGAIFNPLQGRLEVEHRAGVIRAVGELVHRPHDLVAALDLLADLPEDLLEPRQVGRFAGQDVALNRRQQAVLGSDVERETGKPDYSFGTGVTLIDWTVEIIERQTIEKTLSARVHEENEGEEE